MDKSLMFIACCFTGIAFAQGASIEASFKENAIFKPLEDGKVWAHLQFEMVTGLESQHFTLFPKSLGQILHKFDVEELHFTLTHGRWMLRQWGAPSPHINITTEQLGEVNFSPKPGPVGAQLWGWLKGQESEEIDQRWVELQHALAGIMCASLHQIGRSSSRPTWTFAPNNPGLEASQLRYGALPRENLCTENLTPWLKLLPCRNKAGLGALLTSRRLFESSFHTLAAHVTPLRADDQKHIGWLLSQTVDIVLEAPHHNYDWSLQQLFGIDVGTKVSRCTVASQASINVLIPQWMTVMVPESMMGGAKARGAVATVSDPISISVEPVKKKKKPSQIILSPEPEIVVDSGNGIIYVYPLIDDNSIALSCTYSGSRSWTKHGITTGLFRSTPPLSVSRFIGGRGQHMGTMTVQIQNTHPETGFTVNYYDAIPWFLRLFYHTLTITINGKAVDPYADVERLRFFPSPNRGVPAELEMKIEIPPTSLITVSIDFEKAFLRITEFPPDVSRGFDVQSGIVSVVTQDGEDKEAIRLYTDGALVRLPFPDFSMPFNVVAFTSTVIAFFFGSVFNILSSPPDELLRRGRTSLLQRIIMWLAPQWKKLFRRCKRGNKAKAQEEEDKDKKER